MQGFGSTASCREIDEQLSIRYSSQTATLAADLKGWCKQLCQHPAFQQRKNAGPSQGRRKSWGCLEHAKSSKFGSAAIRADQSRLFPNKHEHTKKNQSSKIQQRMLISITVRLHYYRLRRPRLDRSPKLREPHDRIPLGRELTIPLPLPRGLKLDRLKPTGRNGLELLQLFQAQLTEERDSSATSQASTTTFTPDERSA